MPKYHLKNLLPVRYLVASTRLSTLRDILKEYTQLIYKGIDVIFIYLKVIWKVLLDSVCGCRDKIKTGSLEEDGTPTSKLFRFRSQHYPGPSPEEKMFL